MKRIVLVCGVVVACAMVVGSAAAQELFVFPQNGQDQAQQDSDRGECHVWATNQSGFDPTTARTTPPPAREARQGGVVRGGAMGAAGGAAVGAIAGNAGKGAAMGAVGGGLIGGARRSNQQQRHAQDRRNWQADQDAQRAGYRRALTACLEGKGYTVR